MNKRNLKFITVLTLLVSLFSVSFLTSARKEGGQDLDIVAYNSSAPINGVKERIIGAPLIKFSAAGFFAADIWKGLSINDDPGTNVTTGVLGVTGSFDYFPARAFWHIGVDYSWITTSYKTNLHIILGELGYSFRPTRNFYITPSISGGVILGSRTFNMEEVPSVGWQMGVSVAFSYRIYDGLCIDLEPKMFFGSDKHNAFSFIPVTVGLSYFY